ncbi:non-ribosomal peptide synthetase [Phormidesmis priestleyi ULC007]|uniref:Non-ribosomal peptide synthetase n=1 Tax=Phormidesmis priestleyi ULC007 TaxID=1920490 RepID=A0A2T1DB42_9CYAN|nr:non-ribosomal peptide synthetase [Phormidesmis priestleyi]PSB17677.1 non-ribosomal peptide synthetase [Phormidesmis priestleyi ULC007]
MKQTNDFLAVSENNFGTIEEDVFVFPASFAQQRLWFLSQLQEGSVVYNIPSALQLTGVLNLAALKQALTEIVQRHEVLRTHFQLHDGSLVQLISPTADFDLTLVDLRSLPSAEQAQHVQDFAFQSAQAPFDLATGSLVRVSLLQLAEHSHVLLVTLHHIVSDAWSTSIFIREVAALYAAFLQGQPSPLDPLPIQYADFAHWQRQSLSGDILTTQLAYWQHQLAGAPPLLELPSDRTRPAVQRFAGGTEQFQLDSPLSQQLVALSQSAGTTLFMTLLAAFATLLARSSHQDDIVIGSPIANRTRRELELLIGFFVNTLVLRLPLQSNPTFLELLQRVKQVAMEAYAHQDLPFEQLVEALQPERSLSHTPLFQVMFAWQNAPMGQLELPGLTLELLDIANVTAKFDLLLSMAETEAGLTGVWEYNSDLFDASTIRRLSGHFQTLLQAIVTHPEHPIATLPLLPPSERQQVVEQWNQTQVEYSQACIHHLFEMQVERTPDAVAAVFEQHQLTYRQLNQRANQLAHYLQSLGVGAEGLVGICLERSLEMLVAVLGVLKAGGAYVPLDPAYPAERLAVMLEDTPIAVLLTDSTLAVKLPSQSGSVVCVEQVWRELAQLSQANPTSGVQLDNLIYVIFTSGSTGRPKGVMNTHRGICNRLLWMQETYPLASHDRVLQKTPYSFDVSVWELFWPLLTGACLVLCKPEGHKDSAYLLQLIQEQQITTLHFVPSMLQAFLGVSGLNACHCLKRVFCSGESLPFQLQERFFAHLSCELHNLYGPTEAAIDVTFWQCQRDSVQPIVSLGYPISNIQLYILDHYLQSVPIGIPGELHIGGVGLARGYLNRPDLTAEKFIPHPFSPEPGSRLYKTGDLARYLSDGTIEFLGRMDHQVKLRGFRIELGEIEAVLRQDPQIREAVVILREDQPGDKRLVAYIVASTESIDTREVSRFLKEKLPDYMVPSAFVQLAALPLTANGKCDRRALPAPQASINSATRFVLPSTSTEKILAAIWAQALGLTEVGIYDNFFELGGDSIKAIQVVSRLAQHNLRIKERHLFQFPTIAELVQQAVLHENQADQRIVLGIVPLTPIQLRFLSTYPGKKHHFNQSIMLATAERWNVDALRCVVRQIQCHHDALRLRFRTIDEAIVQECADVEHCFDLEVIDLVGQVDAIHRLETEADRVQSSMDLDHGPLIRFMLFHLDQGDRLLMAAHHLVIDGVSWRILLEDLAQGYDQACAGSEIRFPAKTDSYQRWSMTLQEYSTSQLLQQEVEYWQHLTNTVVDTFTIDVPEGENLVRDSCTLDFALTPEETDSLLKKVHRPYNTEINDILLTALAHALHRWCGYRSFLIDLEGHGRVDDIDGVDVCRTVGWFTSIYPVLLDLGSTSDLGYQIKSIKEMLRQIPHKGIGYGIWCYLILNEQERNAWIDQQSAILFNYLGRIDEDIRFSRFDLAEEPCGNLIDPESARTHELEFSGFVHEGKLRFSVTFSTDRFHLQTIQRLLENYEQALKEIVEHCQQQQTIELTPADLTYDNLSLEEFEEIFTEE